MMPPAEQRPHGSWRSPISSQLIVSETVTLGQIALDGTDTYWTELRPSEGGRIVVVHRAADGTTRDVNAAPLNARTRVHEYGGGAVLVHDGVVYFSNYADQRLYRQRSGEGVEPLTAPGQSRYADGRFDARRNRIVCVREDHSPSDREAINTIVAVGAADGSETVLAGGADFYSNPRISPQGDYLAWLEWNHPLMPWDGTWLRVARIEDDGSLGPSQVVAGGERESVLQPRWSPDGILYFISDRSGWWNIYRQRLTQIEPICPRDAEFASPPWSFGTSNYGFAASDTLWCVWREPAGQKLARIDTGTLDVEPLELPYTSLGALEVNASRAVLIGGSSRAPAAVVEIDLATGQPRELRRASHVEVPAGYLSAPEPIEFRTEGGRTAFAYYYPPRNQDFAAPPGELPPLVVKSHGGPTGSTSTNWNLSIQYWTSRGLAVVDVDYGGSTGYGREYRERLRGNWGIVDVDDCTNAARHLVAAGRADPNRLAITGGSAGGYTTLCALVFRDVFNAGASHFGLSELTVFVHDTHKFESRYLDSLIGPFPERKDLYEARSPIRFVDQLDCPVIFFQGDEDKIVPPNQTELMVDALRAKQLPVAYLLFQGEQHGFRQAKNIRRALDAELYFYARVFGFELAEPIEPVEIENLPG